jgi:hypothetical protein
LIAYVTDSLPDPQRDKIPIPQQFAQGRPVKACRKACWLSATVGFVFIIRAESTLVIELIQRICITHNAVLCLFCLLLN